VLALQQQQQQKAQQGWLGGSIPATTAAAAAAAGDDRQEQQPGGLQQLASGTMADEFESFADASEQLASESSSSSTGAPGEAEQQSSSSSEQLPLPYTEAELGAMIGGTLNRQYWESIHDGAGSVRDVYSIRGPHYLRDRKKIPAGGHSRVDLQARKLLGLVDSRVPLEYVPDLPLASACQNQVNKSAAGLSR
jgi:hypothetical protein